MCGCGCGLKAPGANHYYRGASGEGGVGKPTMLGTCFRITPLLRCSGRGTPWIARGYFIRVGSSFAGILVVTARYSPLNFALGTGTDAVRHICSVVLVRNVGALDREVGTPGKEFETPCDALIVDSRERPEEMPAVLPRDFLARMISSNRRISGFVDGCVSLRWMNSLNTAGS